MRDKETLRVQMTASLTEIPAEHSEGSALSTLYTELLQIRLRPIMAQP